MYPFFSYLRFIHGYIADPILALVHFSTAVMLIEYMLYLKIFVNFSILTFQFQYPINVSVSSKKIRLF